MGWYSGSKWGGDADGWSAAAAAGAGDPTGLGSKLLAYYDPANASPKNDLSGNGYHLTDVTGTPIAIDANAFTTGKPGFNFTGAEALRAGSVAHGGGSALGCCMAFKLNSASANNSRIIAYIDPGQAGDWDNNTSALLISRLANVATVQGFRNSNS